jgi:predicted RNA binding protein YcfA (HicA-like mRNA interferase family)
VQPKRLLAKLGRGHLQNVRFLDLQKLVETLGFRLARVKGSHHVYVHLRVQEVLNLQDVQGEAKPYQIRQLLRLVERYNLSPEDRF